MTSLQEFHNLGEEDAANGVDRSISGWSEEGKRAYLDGYWHTRGQIDGSQGRTDWLVGGFGKIDKANKRAYDDGHKSGYDTAHYNARFASPPVEHESVVAEDTENREPEEPTVRTREEEEPRSSGGGGGPSLDWLGDGGGGVAALIVGSIFFLMFYAAYPTVGGIILSGIALAVVGGVLFFTWAFGYGLYLVLGRVGIVFAGIAVAAIAAWYLWDNSPSNVVARQQEQQKQERQRQQQELERQQQEHLRQERIRREAQERQRQEDINRR